MRRLPIAAATAATLVAAMVLATVPGAQAAVRMPQGDAQAGQRKAAACAVCHGVDGNSPGVQFPTLAGQPARYLYKQMQDFRSAQRAYPLMRAAIVPFGDQDLADLASWYAAQKPAGGTADPALVARGEKLYRGGDRTAGIAPCMGCHGPAGLGNGPAAFPRLAGQRAAYLKAQLVTFRAAGRDDETGQRRTNDTDRHEPGPMQMISAHLSDKDIDALAAFLQGLR